MCKNKDIIVVYKFQPHNKVNGTLFYCFEYTMQLLELDQNVNFYIYNIKDEKDKDLVEKCFKDKYKEEYYKYFDNIIFLNSIINFANIIKNKHYNILSLDIKTYNDYSKFAKVHEKFAYINNNYKDHNYDEIKPQLNTKFFGYYEYQYMIDTNLKYEFESELLKLGTKYQKQFDILQNNFTFVSAPHPDRVPIYYFESPYLLKASNNIIENLFESINKIIYIHNDIDTNNRIIVEAFYHKKDFKLMNELPTNDSVMHRYELCLSGKINKLILDEKDKLIKSIIG